MEGERRTSLKGRRRSCCKAGRVCDTLMEMDMFARKPELRLPSGKTSYNTAIGCCCTVILFLIVVAFGGLTMLGLLDTSDSSALSRNVSMSHAIDANYFYFN